jgi:sulfate permease, SulP family
MLQELKKELAQNGVVLRLVEAHGSVRDLLRLEGAENWCGQIDRFQTVAAAIDGYSDQEHS